MRVDIYNGDNIAENLSLFGCPSIYDGYTLTPSAVLYHFTPSNMAKYKETQARRAVERLLLFAGESGQFLPSVSGFTLSIKRAGRNFPTFSECVRTGEDFSIGIDDNGNIKGINLDDCPHILAAGATGSGKTVFLHNAIAGLCCNSSAGLVLIDMKGTEFIKWANCPRLLTPIITEAAEAVACLNNLVEEMSRRYKTGAAAGGFNKIVVIVDELADLMLANKKAVESPLIRLAQKGRACGIHLILATQRPSVNIITGILKANLPVRVCFSVASATDSVVMLGHKGGEKLLGKGDGIAKLADGEEFHFQAPYISDEQIAELLQGCDPPKFKKSHKITLPRFSKKTIKRALIGLTLTLVAIFLII